MENSLKCTLAGVKIASRCNINCTYCYMYNKGDSSFLGRPKVMHENTVDNLMKRVKSHCSLHEIEEFTFVLHGGEPLLAGKEFFKSFVNKAKKALEPETKVLFSTQTNAILLDDEWCDLLAELDISIGISIDGTKEANDQYRIDHKGKGTYEKVVKGLKITQNSTSLRKKGIEAGLLSVMNIETDPMEVYEHFKNLQVKSVDFGLPDNTYDDLPPGKTQQHRMHDQSTPYADWLIPIFDRWFYEKEHFLRIRFFEDIISLVLGKKISYDQVGQENLEILVIETDGSIEALDVLRICGDGFTQAGTNVDSNDIDEALQTELAKLYHTSKQKLTKQCTVCPVKEICGGGYIPHRYSKENGFNNPSLYCSDLLKMITHIQNRVLSELPQSVLERYDVELLSFEEAKRIIDQELVLAEEPAYLKELEEFKVNQE